MKFELKIINRNISEEDLIQDLQRVAKVLNQSTVSRPDYEKHGTYSTSTYGRRFGSWTKALEVAGLETSYIKINLSEEILFKNIEEIWIKLGRQPKYDEMKAPLSRFSSSTYENRFGTWMKGLQAFIDFINQDIEESNNNSTIEISGISDLPFKIVHKTKREISDRLRFRILMRDGFTCKSCGKSPLNQIGVELHVDHILPWSKGGETVPDNLETKCSQCNLGKGNILEE